MVFDDLRYADKYRSLSNNIATAIDWLKNTDIGSLEAPQVITVDGDKVIAQIQSYTTVPESEGKYESHKNYVDIQYVHSGTELMKWTPLHRLTGATEYDEERDVLFYEDAPGNSLTVEPSQFAIFFPEDGHKPKCAYQTPQQISKIVLKVAV